MAKVNPSQPNQMEAAQNIQEDDLQSAVMLLRNARSYIVVTKKQRAVALNNVTARIG